MRYIITKRSSTKSERIVYEVLKKAKIPFKHRWLVEGHEIDFVIFDKVCLEIDGHEQNTYKNELLVKYGYIPIHLNNSEVTTESITKLINNYVTK